jgi:hypothetical protein
MTNKTIQVKIIDEFIQDAMIVAYEISQALAAYDQITLDFMNESPCLTCTAFKDFFQYLCDQDIDLSRINVVTGNLIERAPGVNTVPDPRCMVEISEVKKYLDQVPRSKNIRFHFINLVGRCNWPRMVLGAHLYRFHQSRSLQTFHWRADSDFSRMHMQLEELLHEYGPNSVEFDTVIDLLKSAPLTLDDLPQGYPIQHDFNIVTPCTWYPWAFVDIVCESWWQGDNFFITEKFLRSVITRTPFILQGPKGSLQRLQKLGFKTFSSYWDESYDTEPAHYNLVSMRQTIDYLGTLQISDLQQMWQHMLPLLDHNLQRFMDLTNDDLRQL